LSHTTAYDTSQVNWPTSYYFSLPQDIIMQQPTTLLTLTKLHYKTSAALILSTASFFMTPDAVAQEDWAIQLGEYPKCTNCHTSQPGEKSTVKPAAKQAYRDGDVIPGLRDYLKSLASNTKPTLLAIDNQWNAQIGEAPLTIPLLVKDKESDSFTMQLSNAANAKAPKGYSFSSLYTVAGINLPAINFVWKPTAAQKNKNYPVIFQAKETTSTGSTQLSNTVSATIFVWAARPVSTKYVIEQFVISNAKWATNKLTVSGLIKFKKSSTAATRAAALKTLRLNIKSNAGTVVGMPLLLSPKAGTGAWTSTLALTATQVPCLIKAEYEKLTTARAVKPAPASCLK
jgi:hypothetical protein